MGGASGDCRDRNGREAMKKYGMTVIFEGIVIYCTDKLAMIEDKAGNVFIWHTSGIANWQDKKVHLEGSVKDIKVMHGDYKLTIVTNCKPFKGL